MTKSHGLLASLMTMVFQVPLSAQDADIIDTAVSAGSFETLLAAVESAGLTEALRCDGPFTVFAPTNRSVFDFDGGDRDAWFVLNDDVMGGISTSKTSLSDRDTLLFEGRLSLESNGGFASTRSHDYDMDLDGVEAFALRVLGDGRSYWFGVRTDSRGNSGYWRAPFETVKGEWTEITIPVDQLRYSFRGREIDRGEVDPAKIRSMSILISDKNDREPFRLEVDWIRAIPGDS